MSGKRTPTSTWIAGGLCALTVVLIVISVSLKLQGPAQATPPPARRAPPGRRGAAYGGGRRADRCPPAGQPHRWTAARRSPRAQQLSTCHKLCGDRSGEARRRDGRLGRNPPRTADHCGHLSAGLAVPHRPPAVTALAPGGQRHRGLGGRRCRLHRLLLEVKIGEVAVGDNPLPLPAAVEEFGRRVGGIWFAAELLAFLLLLAVVASLLVRFRHAAAWSVSS
jgi:hypothetical protein